MEGRRGVLPPVSPLAEILVAPTFYHVQFMTVQMKSSQSRTEQMGEAQEIGMFTAHSPLWLLGSPVNYQKITSVEAELQTPVYNHYFCHCWHGFC